VTVPVAGETVRIEATGAAEAPAPVATDAGSAEAAQAPGQDA
jgi:hypothetical protein